MSQENSNWIGNQTCAGFLGALASTEPTPGGGAVAGLIGATASALGEMVAGYSLGKSGDPSIEESIETIKSELGRARQVFLRLADEDAAAYAVLNAAFKQPKSDEGRQDAIRAGAAAAIQPPLATLATAGDVARLLEKLLPHSNRNLASDLGIAADLTISTANAALWNIDANASLLGDEGTEIQKRSCDLINDISGRAGFVETACRSR